ncbi:MAG: hypothetical protein HY043_13075 [Verrucomicrobia bacterium]|nr:hypothetical protein [Verrucomicrobiota bacterium]
MNKPNLPGEIQPGPQYSFAVDCKVNAWMFVALMISVASDLFYRHQVREWPAYLRTIAAVAPLLAILLWIRRLAGWIHGMDELHRQVTSAACLFASTVTFFFIVAWQHLVRLGVFQVVFPGRMKAYANLDLCVPWLILWLLLISYAVGQRIFNRRYR